jgi:hypothetical protein
MLKICSRNSLNIRQYTPGAYAQVLPLVGGGANDLTTVFSGRVLLQHDTGVAAPLRYSGVGGSERQLDAGDLALA